jgi:hypothetical protein
MQGGTCTQYARRLHRSYPSKGAPRSRTPTPTSESVPPPEAAPPPASTVRPAPPSRPTQPTVLSREELYAAVWETPMSRWRSNMDSAATGSPNLRQGEHPISVPRLLGETRRQQGLKASASVGVGDSGAPDHHSPDSHAASRATQNVRRQVEAARTKAASITVPERLVKPHPIIAGNGHTATESKRATPQLQSDGVDVSTSCEAASGRGCGGRHPVGRLTAQSYQKRNGCRVHRRTRATQRCMRSYIRAPRSV